MPIRNRIAQSIKEKISDEKKANHIVKKFFITALTEIIQPTGGTKM